MFSRFKDQKGGVAVMAAVVTTMVMGFTALAVDVGMVLTARNQLQNAADSAALAAASKLDAPANQAEVISTAQQYASSNKVLNQPVVLQTNDIVITDNPDMALRRVKVTAHRTSARGNPVNLSFARAIGYNSVDITASSKAGPIPVKGTNGIRPWAVRDKCLSTFEDDDDDSDDNSNDNSDDNDNDNSDDNENDNSDDNGNDNGHGHDNENDNSDDNSNDNSDDNSNDNSDNGNDNSDDGNSNDNGNENSDDDEETGCTGYEYPAVGELVTLKYGPQDDREEPHWFSPVDLPPVNKDSPIPGADAYRDNIENGYSGMVEIGDILRVEPGNMAGPTEQGVNYLIGLDSMAYWDSFTNQVEGSSYPEGQSPRVIKIVFYDPNIGIVGHPGEITVTRIGAFFLEGSSGPPDSNVTGRFIETVSSGLLDINAQSRVFGIGLLE